MDKKTRIDNKAQSALEYLMTYGWALIVIAIVIGVLIFVTSGATGGVTCQSSSTGAVLKEWSVTGTSVGLTIQNATGGQISPIKADGSGKFTDSNSNLGPAVDKSNTFTVTGIGVDSAKPSTFSDGIVTVSYTTEGGLPGQAVITCSGTVS